MKVSAPSQQAHAIRACEGTAGRLGQPLLEPGVERADGVETSRRLDRLERDLRPLFTRVRLSGAAHPATPLQQRPHAGCAIRG